MKCKYVELTSDYVYPYRNQINQPKFAGSSCQGWTYALNGSLLKATRIKGIRNFDVENFGLKPLKVATWAAWATLSEVCLNSSLHFLRRREYIIKCNWKVFCDNYLDGGYHVPYAHKGLASGLKLDSYLTTLHDKVSLQCCDGGPVDGEYDFDRLGKRATYAFIYPNFMINRYVPIVHKLIINIHSNKYFRGNITFSLGMDGPWMDTNLVLPLGPRKCCVIFDYFPEGSLLDDHAFIDRSLQDSERVQVLPCPWNVLFLYRSGHRKTHTITISLQTEDIVLCEGVQRVLESPAYCSGRYAPTVENAMHHFHCLLHHNLTT
ncbi:hypothetical protein MLD38_036772 [Melastoma candidum]|uniref:Uncharacterized protein n=1 Tax=Melastoma candidum TaxID=119954 RepID=A0ACB9LKY9_9MYRT|nr:hypothetical protein MLD38_036772 [Melastoma candidum]